MIRSTKNWGVLSVAAIVATGTFFVAEGRSQTTIQRPRPGGAAVALSAKPDQVSINKSADVHIPTEIEKLTERVNKLEARLDAKIDSKVRALDAKIDAMQLENKDLKGEVARLHWDLYYPGGQVGLKRKAIQKSAADRIPGDAWLVYYQR